MKAIYYDCFAGISGDMNLGAMVDLGADKDALVAELRKLNLDGWKLEFSRDSRAGIFGTKAEVVLDDAHHHDAHAEHAHCAHAHSDCEPTEHTHEHKHDAHAHSHEHRAYSDIVKIVEESGISERAKKLSLAIFEKIATAEAKIHGANIADVKFHEVGALDSIVDIVGAAVCADLLGAEKFACSAVELGGGTVRCAHGVMPVPAPATAEILRGVPVRLNGAPHECTTPTGAAILAALCDSFGGKIEGRIIANGVGIGHRVCAELPNVLRVSLVELSESPELASENMKVIEANIDDMTAEELAFACSRLFDAGAADVWQECISGKKSRMGAKLCALVRADMLDAVVACVFTNTTTLGARISEVKRISLPRKTEIFESSLGAVGIKTADFLGRKKIKPEFDDCMKISVKKNMPLGEVRRIVENEYKA